jgi:hypothetical protein
LKESGRYYLYVLLNEDPVKNAPLELDITKSQEEEEHVEKAR